jgi:hypothetical protein
MSFPLYPNTTAGLASIGPVQAMSDRNEAQTYMANGGQMFASGGITSYAGGGLNALPKYKYDPVTQRYVLEEEEAPKAGAGLENLATRSGGGDSAQSEPSGWDKMSNAQKAAYYAENPRMAAITQFGQSLFGRTGLGSLSAYTNPQAWGEAQAVAKGFDPSQTSFGRGAGSLFGFFGSGLEAVPKAGVDVYGYAPVGMNTMSDYGTRGGVSGIGVGSSSGINSMDAQSDAATGGGFTGADSNGGFAPSTAGELAQGGLAALAGGGQSHLGDYSDGGRLLRGPGDGVSDSIPATIGDKRPARLADGEFVVPARIVSELGNGSTEAGARKLYEMMARIQKARSKTVGKDRVAVNSRADKNLPA